MCWLSEKRLLEYLAEFGTKLPDSDEKWEQEYELTFEVTGEPNEPPKIESTETAMPESEKRTRSARDLSDRANLVGDVTLTPHDIGRLLLLAIDDIEGIEHRLTALEQAAEQRENDLRDTVEGGAE
jgi:hypothetical protein